MKKIIYVACVKLSGAGVTSLAWGLRYAGQDWMVQENDLGVLHVVNIKFNCSIFRRGRQVGLIDHDGSLMRMSWFEQRLISCSLDAVVDKFAVLRKPVAIAA